VEHSLGSENSARPVIWVLTGDKTGDNAQALRAADAMGLAFETRHIAVLAGHAAAKPKVEASLHHIDQDASDPLAQPWPDLVITIGRRLSLVALWIKQQSGGRTRIALLNAPKGQQDRFDLLIVPAFYRIADGPRVCRIGLPLIAVDPGRLAAAKARFASSLDAMVRPLHVLLLGGDMGSRKLDPGFAVSVVEQMRAGFAANGSIFVSTSRRTAENVADAVERALRLGDRLYRWRAGAQDNPFLGLLAHGDSFTITNDSVSMLTEVARLAKPLVIAEPPDRSGLLARLAERMGRGSMRDLQSAANFLCDGGYAVRLGDTPRAPAAPPPDDSGRVGRRLRQLAFDGN
jgi:mitochondrial fission protein ELM1